MIIRPARQDDLTGILGVEEVAMIGPWSRAQLEDEFRHPASLLLVAELDDGAVGYLGCRTLAPEAELLRLAVLSSSRRQGLGVGLLDFALTRLAPLGIERIFVEVRSSNGPARSFYNNYGFTGIGLRPGYYRRPTEDAVVLQYAIHGSAEEA